LGLSLCQGLIEGHGGSIRAKSQPGQGAVFVVELPVQTPPTTVSDIGAGETTVPIEGKTILVVDDEPEVAAVLADMLSADGHQVETAENGAIALDRVRARAFDLILCDLWMPELDGPGFYQELQRRDPRLSHRVIFLTGDALSPRITEFVEATAAPTMSKPFTLGEVRRVVQSALRAL
jgi:two-component system NtrC family sensor kinase